MNDEYSKGVAVFIIKDEMILLTKRIKGGFTGYWEVPAGHIKESESVEETAIREVKEETNLVVNCITKIGTNTNDQYKFCAQLVTAEIVSGKAKNIDTYNHSDLKWFPLSNLPLPLGASTIKGLNILNYL